MQTPRPQFYPALLLLHSQWNAGLKTTILARLLSGHKKPILASLAGITFEISAVIIVKIVFSKYLLHCICI